MFSNYFIGLKDKIRDFYKLTKDIWKWNRQAAEILGELSEIEEKREINIGDAKYSFLGRSVLEPHPKKIDYGLLETIIKEKELENHKQY